MDLVLKVLKSLYNVPKASNYWFKTYYLYYTQQLRTEQSTYNPCLLYSNEPFSIVGLQTNNTLFLTDKVFTTTKQTELQKAKFIAKDQE